MNIESFLRWFVNLLSGFFSFLDSAVLFKAFGATVSYLDFVGSAIVLTMVVSLFWRGAKG